MIINESFPGKVHAVAITDVGARHTAMGLTNQDCSAFYFQDDQFFMAVSDGVGSCNPCAKSLVTLHVQFCVKWV